MAFIFSARRRWAVGASIAAMALIAGACATLGRANFKEPVVTLKEFTITGLGISGGSVDVVLNVYNPNRFKLDATKMTYRVDVDTVQLGNGEIATYAVVDRAGRDERPTGSPEPRICESDGKAHGR